MARKKPSTAEKRWIAKLTPEERRMVREEDATREMADKLVLVEPEPPVGPQQPPTEAQVQAAKDEVFDLFMQPLIDRAIKIILARNALPGESIVYEARRCLLCELPIPEGTSARRDDAGRAMHSTCVEKAQALGAELERQTRFKPKYAELLALRAQSEGPGNKKARGVSRGPSRSVH